jgi:multicomponent Na+:H+ antiporter subunit E
MNFFLFNIALAVAWAAAMGEFNLANLLIGFALGYVALYGARRAFPPSPYFARTHRALSLFFFFVKEIVLANLKVAASVITPSFDMRPRVLAVPLEARTDEEITCLANMISLTPGTLSLDVSTDRRVLYVHFMFAEDAEAARIEITQGLERKLLTVFRAGLEPRGEGPR